MWLLNAFKKMNKWLMGLSPAVYHLHAAHASCIPDPLVSFQASSHPTHLTKLDPLVMCELQHHLSLL